MKYAEMKRRFNVARTTFAIIENNGNDEIQISSLVFPANLCKYFLSGNEFHIASVDLGNPLLGFCGPQTVNLCMGGQVETCKEFLDQTDPRIRWQRKRIVKKPYQQ
jgi:hypothetical protein